MRRLVLLAAIVFLGLAATALYVRSVEHEPGRWHVDPEAATRTGKPNDFLLSGDTAPRFDKAPDAVAAALHRIALSEPRTRLIGGDPSDGHMTYVQSSAAFAFPDYVSVRVIPSEAGARVAIWSRARFGHSDLGVNRARVERWLGALPEEIGG